MAADLDFTDQEKQNSERRQNLKKQLQGGTRTLNQYISDVAYTFNSSVSAFQPLGDSAGEGRDEHQGLDNKLADAQDVHPEL